MSDSYVPKRVLRELGWGYDRYIRGEMKHPNTGLKDLKAVSGKQTPEVCILGCADSRVPPEIIFDQGLGDVFVLRVAGNFADEDNQASLEYALGHFDPAPAVIVVLGHERCGAITEALKQFEHGFKEKYEQVNPPKHKPSESTDSHPADHGDAHSKTKSNVDMLLDNLNDAVTGSRSQCQLKDYKDLKAYVDARIEAAVRENIRLQVNILKGNKAIGGLVAQNRCIVLGARFDLDDGKIEWLTTRGDGTGEWSATIPDQTSAMQTENLVEGQDMTESGLTIHFEKPYKNVASVEFTMRAETDACSSAYYYFNNPKGEKVGEAHVEPCDYAEASGTAIFEVPNEIASVTMYSWWNHSIAEKLIFTYYDDEDA